MMRDYLIQLRPLEPFLFGGEHNFDYGTRRQTPQRYYIASEDRPSQTTLFGTLRYAVLAANNALITEYGNREQIDRAEKLIGRNSFDIAAKNQSFGDIDSISPLFLIHYEQEQEHRLVPLPLNHAYNEKNSQYIPCTMTENSAVVTNRSFTAMYAEDRNQKHSVKGWVSLKDGSIFSYDKILTEFLQVGINAHRTDGVRDQEDSFFKKSKLIFANPRDTFAFYARLDLTDEAAAAFVGGIPVAMGQGKTPFLLTAEPEDNTLAADIQTSFEKWNEGKRPFCYALSDSYLEKIPEVFFFAETKPFRYLTTDLHQKTHLSRLHRTHTLYRLFSAGAVFYGSTPEAPNHVQTIGLNHFITIGGNT